MKKILTVAAVVASVMATVPGNATATVDVNISLDAYLPAPPGVTVRIEAGRPYYIRDHRRIYLEKRPKHDRGRHLGHDKKERHGGKGEHGRKGGHR